MGKPFGLLHRIFSFSRGSKQSATNLTPDEHGRHPRNQDPDQTPPLSYGTTGGVGSLGRGITNAPGETRHSSTAITNDKEGENGLRKRLLRRASLSASDLLSWGHEKSVKRATSQSGAPKRFGSSHSHLNKGRESSNQPLRINIDVKCDENHDIPKLGQRDDGSHYNNRVVAGLALSNGSSQRGKRGEGDLHEQMQGNEDLTRLLRSSSANYRVISETDYRDMAPLEHPINAVALNRSPGVSPFSTKSRSNPPISWPSHLPLINVTLPSTHVPGSLLHTRSVSSTSASTYKVTVHRRRIHSRTSFPDANRAFDHLHSSSPITAFSSPSASPRSSSDVPEITPCKAIQVEPSTVSNMREQSRAPHRVEPSSYPGRSLSGKAPPPSALLRSSSRRQSTMQAAGHNEGAHRRSEAVNLRLHPVIPMARISSTSRGTNSASLETHFLDEDQAKSRAKNLSTKLPHDAGGNPSRTSLMDNVVLYKNSLQGSDTSLANEDAYDGIIKKAPEIELGQHTSPAPSTLATPFTKKLPRKVRNVLKKKRRGSQTSLVQAAEALSGREPSIDEGEARHEKGGSCSNLRTVLGVLQAVEGVVDRLHASAVGEQALSSPRRQRSQERVAEWVVVSANRMSPASVLESSQANSHPARGRPYSCLPLDGKQVRGIRDLNSVTPPRRWPSFQETPRNQARLAKLRRDPSVASLLEIYQTDGTLRGDVFSNTPPTKPQPVLDKRHTLIERLAIPSGRKMARCNGIRETDLGSRSAWMNRTCVKASGEPTFGESVQPKVSGEHVRPPSVLQTSPAFNVTATLISQPATNKVSALLASPALSLEVGRTGKSGASASRPDDGIYSAAPSSNTQPEASFSTENEESSKTMDVSLFVEPGSNVHFGDTSCGSTSDRGILAESKLWTPRTREEDEDVVKEAISRSPNRRASEVFSFLDPALRAGHESFEAGTLSWREGAGQGEPISRQIVDEEPIPRPQSPLGRKSSQLMPSPSPLRSGHYSSKRPHGPRTAVGLGLGDLPPGTDKKSMVDVKIPDGTTQLSTSNIPASPVPDGEHDSPPMALTGATFESDSFASQNTTDRSLYRGIYKYLNGTQSNSGYDKVTQAVVEGNAADILLHASLNDENNPFLTNPFDYDKSLPRTPSPATSDVDCRELRGGQHKKAEDFVSLPSLSPMSPLVANIATRNDSLKDGYHPSSLPEVRNTVKERIAMWESTKPIIVDKGSLQRLPSTKSHLETTSAAKKSGLGDGRVSNIPRVPGRMYGPRSPSPQKKSTNRTTSQRLSIKDTKSVDLTQNYPFSQDLFPAIFSPGGPAVVKPNNLLRTPQRLSTQPDASPASSSKLGVYGREIMALARSKSAARAGHDTVDPL